MKVLIIDDDKDCCDALYNFVRKIQDCKVYKAYLGVDGFSLIKKEKIDLIISDIDMPGLNGLELVNLVKSGNFETDVVLISGKEDVIKSVNSIDLGIFDFLTKPVDIYDIENIINDVKTKNNLKEELNIFKKKNLLILKDNEIIDINNNSIVQFMEKYPESGYSFSKKMDTVYKKLKKLINYPEIPLLLEGETGVGKEVAAKFIHNHSDGKYQPFIGINCASVNKDIFESEFFGYKKGAFTGANSDGRKGYIKASENGTLFLDEISEIPLHLQTKLLRVLEEKEYFKVGSVEKEKVKSRIIFATNKDLPDLVKKGLFREDLLFRISICKINIPPLRDRSQEIIPIGFFYINEVNKKVKNSASVNKIEVGIFKKLLSYKWPGNIRELKNVITNLVIFNNGSVLKSDTLNLDKKIKLASEEDNILSLDNFELPDNSFNIEEYTNNIVKKALEKFKGNKSKTAKYLGLTRIQLYKRFKVDDFE